MSAEDRVRWDRVFREQANTPYPDPDPLLLRYTPPHDAQPETEAPRALDLAAGVGQNGLWLLTQSYFVDLMDISRVALQRARQEMAMRNLRNANLLQVDADILQLPPAQYDLICVFRYMRRRLFPFLRGSLKPGGLIIYETFTLSYLEQVPAFNRVFLLQAGELAEQFNNWHIIHSEEVDCRAQLVAQKPHDA